MQYPPGESSTIVLMHVRHLNAIVSSKSLPQALCLLSFSSLPSLPHSFSVAASLFLLPLMLFHLTLPFCAYPCLPSLSRTPAIYISTCASLFYYLYIRIATCIFATSPAGTAVAACQSCMYVRMLCYVMLCYVMLCYVMLCLCHVMLMLCYVMLCYVMLCYACM